MADVLGGRRVGVLAAALTASCLAAIWLASPVLQLAAGGASLAMALRLLAQALRHVRIARTLDTGSVPGRTAGIALRWRPFRSGAAVAGLRRPTIYCDPRLERELLDRELSAVVLHERFHQLRRDPVRLLALAAVEPLASLTATGRVWLERQRAALEVAADRFALRHGADRADLAGAILKLGGVAPAGASAGFSSAVELRLRALVDFPGDAAKTQIPGRRTRLLVATFAVAGACGVAIAHHLLALGGTVGCALAGC